MKKIIINCILLILCIIALYINWYKEEYKIIGIICILAVGVIALIKEKIIKL